MFFSKYQRITSLIVVLSFIFLLPGCQQNQQSGDTLSNSTEKKFDRFTENYFQEQLLGSGLNLHFLLEDTSDYADASMSLGEYSYESMQEIQPFCIAKIEELKKIDYQTLDSERQMTYDVLMHSFQSQLDFSDFCLLSEDLSPTLGIQAQLPVLLSEYDFTSRQDIENYLQLLESVQPYFNGICEFQKLKAEKNCFISGSVCDAIITQCKDFLDDSNIEENLLYTSFQNKLDHCKKISDKERRSFSDKNKALLESNVFPAYVHLIDTLSTLKADGACKNENGLAYLEHGREYYEYLVKSETGSSLTVPEIKAMIQTQVVRDIKQLYSLYTISPELESKISENQPSMDADKILTELTQKSRKDFSEISNLQYTLKTVDEQLQDYLSPAFYISPPLDCLDRNIIYINPKKTTDDLYTTLAHEGIPGHLYQNAFFAATNPNKIRYLIGCGGYSEGWAVYAEIQSYNYLYNDQNLAAAQACNESYSLALYCLCDIGVNYEGWNYQDLKSFLSNYNITDDASCHSMFEAVLEDPANYLKYYVGYLEIQKMKKYVMEQTGADFNLKQFHDALLSIGPADFDIVKKWIMHQYKNREPD